MSRLNISFGKMALATAVFFTCHVSYALAEPHHYEPFINLSAHYYSANVDDKDMTAVIDDTQGGSYSITAGVRNRYGLHRLGTSIEYSDIFTTYMIGLRALDYVYQPTDRLTVGAFFGAASLDSGDPQNGYYIGGSAGMLDVIAGLDLAIELRYASGLARDRSVESDPPGEGKPDLFLDISTVAVGLTKRF